MITETMPEIVGVRVLLVEDEILIQMLAEDMISDLGGHLIAKAEHVAQALDLVAEGGFDVAILDLNLNGVKVFPVADALANLAIPFVFASGYGAAGLPPEYRGRPVVAKPFQLEDIGRALASALANGGQHHADLPPGS